MEKKIKRKYLSCGRKRRKKSLYKLLKLTVYLYFLLDLLLIYRRSKVSHDYSNVAQIIKSQRILCPYITQYWMSEYGQNSVNQPNCPKRPNSKHQSAELFEMAEF
jgi:hypothetical protein